MLSIRSFRSGDAVARPGVTSAALLALALLLAACGSEAENTGSSKQAAEKATAATSESTEAAGDKTMMADAGAAADSGAGEAAAEQAEAKQEEQKREPMDGYTVYNRFCTVCHRQGMNAAPKFRDKKAWAPRIAKGKETLYKHSLEGFKAMPAKGGIAGLYDQEVKDAVDYMVKNAGGWDVAEK